MRYYNLISVKTTKSNFLAVITYTEAKIKLTGQDSKEILSKINKTVDKYNIQNAIINIYGKSRYKSYTLKTSNQRIAHSTSRK